MPNTLTRCGSIIVLFLLASQCLSAKEAYPSAKIGQIPQEQIFEMKDHTDALYYWMDAYLEGKIPAGVTLIHVDAHTDDSCGQAKNKKDAQEILRQFQGAPGELRRKTFEWLCKGAKDIDAIGIDSFIIPAMYMGIIKEFIWVAPNFNHFSKDPLLNKDAFFFYRLTSQQLEGCPYCVNDSKLEYDEDGCSIEYFPITHLPAISSPVLLDIDMDFFGVRVVSRYCNLQFSSTKMQLYIDKLIGELTRKAPKVYLVTIADSPDEFSTPEALLGKPYLKQGLTGVTKK